MAYKTAKRRLGYEIAIRPMAESDLDQLHQLSIGVGWPHRPEDWRLVIGLGHGIVACDAIGRVLGSAMWWPFGERFATVGMVITSPRLQAQGAGRELMEMIFAQTGSRDLRLTSTKAGYRLYRSLGFEPIGRIFQHQGKALPPHGPVAAAPGLRQVVPGDLDALAALDASAYGADRRQAIAAALLLASVGTLVERDGAVVGFALCRPFGRGHVVGPIVAEDDAMAIALLTPHVEAHQGAFLRVDTAQEQGAFGAFLESCGLTIFDTVTPMIRGRAHGPSGCARIYGLVNQALG
ncbi:MAG: GNAT family N-acetyltransferase [Bosea sp. (in: a-proteobacteria)]|uniref:GNAT family N-acetyltransferase n=1 Tax=Bosea sp. (in: a-proteobacteria) TaxID=1871050 RepID=UPI002734314F|nr:GNAT family N-acetyltransferase [Bosea sp. (in: a-proteobacteria)]MDP3257514.1 GNAT family N-acetyltransferase [Bosea sp. (in: a-proteobacteria)]MDP3317568.1 GNAT family N-acetyltransferase [Bosea sp. (in: a-proteobacteria)]